MASFVLPIEMRYRLCSVNGLKAIFHRWTHCSEIVEPSLLRGGHCGGVVAEDFGIVEFDDGHIERVRPEKIHFLDSAEMFDAYDWSCRGEEDTNAK